MRVFQMARARPCPTVQVRSTADLRSAASVPQAGPLFGSHLSVAGGMHNAVNGAVRLGFSSVQVFVKNQRQWNASDLKPADIEQWLAARAAANEMQSFGPVVAHASYLINLASADDALFEKSRDAFAAELRRCDALDIAYLVVHPGAAGEQPIETATARIADALNHIHACEPHLRVRPLLEATAGQGTTLGRRFEELGAIMRGLRDPRRVGVCIDTCHVFAAGYDIRDPKLYEEMIATAKGEVGLERIRCWHLNDSKGDLGSRIDRHEHISKGRIGRDGFRNVLRDKRFVGLPMILETPKDETGRWDRDNLKRLRQIMNG